MADWLDLTFFQLDNWAFTQVHGWAKTLGGFLTPLFSLVSLFGKGGIFFLILGAVLLLFRKTRKAGLSVLLAIGIGALFTNVIIKNAVGRLRPYIKVNEYNKMWQLVGANAEKEFSFPSGHATVTMTTFTALILSLGKKKNIWFFVFPLIMGVSRVYLVVHYLTDVIGGLVVGSITGTLGYFAAKGIFMLLEKHKDKRFIKAFLSFDIIERLKKDKD